MTNPQGLEELSTQNDRSLKTLVRTITLTSDRRFELIIVRCNYMSLQGQMVQRLHTECPVDIRELELLPSAQTLYTLIENEFRHQPPSALCILGLDSVDNLEELLLSTNQVREEFRKRFKFPLILWVTDKVIEKLIRLIPDFYNWATPVSFFLPTPDLVALLQDKSDRLFNYTFEASVNYPAVDSIMGLAVSPRDLQELEVARQELHQRNHSLNPELVASLKLALGRDDYKHNRLDAAVKNYQESLIFWQQTNNQARQGMLLFHLGFCYRRWADLERAKNQTHLRTAQECFQQCLDIFEQVNRLELVARFIGQLGEVLRSLEQWADLQRLTEKAIDLHHRYPNPARLARDYGFLAEIALEHSNWLEANQQAQQALRVLAGTTQDQRQRQGLYRLLLAKSQQKLGQVTSAIRSLKKAKSKSDPQDDPLLYIHILETLRTLYFQQSEYFKAFEIRQEQRSIESQYGFRAFIGAGRLQPQRQIKSVLLQSESEETVAREIAASDRQQDVKRLLDRISRDNFKLTIIHGQSGVGKSSIVNAGLIPTLKQEMVGSRDILTISLQLYTNWEKSLYQLLADSLVARGENLLDSFESSAAILQQLQENEYRNLLTVLIFDQFEEFFIGYSKPAARQSFFEFLKGCFKIPYVKVFLVMREDYLHYLLEYERSSHDGYIGRDILNRTNRYEIGNFSSTDAKSIIQSLTERSQFYLEPALVDELVRDLAEDIGEVRPIELQIVGAQLQAENITTLVEYRERGPKAKLVQRYLEEVVEDCGPENERAAELILYLLTGDNDTRPPKTRADLEKDLKGLATDLATEAAKLDLVLRIFVDSGLVFLLPELPANRYQLVHDYLVSFIRRQQEPKLNELIAQLESEREQRQQAEEQRQQAEEQRDKLSELNAQLETEKEERRKTEAELDQAISKANRRTRLGLATFAVALLAASGMGIIISLQYREVEFRRKGAELEREGWQASQKFDSEPFEALLVAMQLGQELKNLAQDRPLSEYPAFSPMFALQRILDNIRVQNRLQGHRGEVNSVIFSPDGQYLATASDDGTAKLWNLEGRQLVSFVNDDKSPILSISFSPNGLSLAAGRKNGTVRLWDLRGLRGKQQAEFKAHKDAINSISFSPDGQYLVTASDKTARLWSLDGKELAVFRHGDKVSSISFSPDGKRLATGSKDGAVRLWDLQGNQQAEFKANEEAINSISFSPDGQHLATASDDQTARLWNLQGKELVVFRGHIAQVVSTSFSQDGQRLATASNDGTVRLWDLRGKQISVLTGNTQPFWSARFSPDGQYLTAATGNGIVYLWNLQSNWIEVKNSKEEALFSASFSPRGDTFATASRNGTVYLWNLDGNRLNAFNAHQKTLRDISFSRNGQQLATASEDKTARLWSLAGRQLAIFKGHTGEVYGVRFNPNKPILATASADGTARLWDLKGHQLKELAAHSGSIWGLDFSPDGETLATGSQDGIVRLWDMQGNLIKTFQKQDTPTPILSVSFSSDGKHIAAGSVDGTAFLFNLKGDLLKNFKAPARIQSISFSPDGKRLVTALANGNTRIWDLNGNLLAELSGHQKTVWAAVFHPDGQHLLTASEDGTARLWQVDDSLDKLLQRSCLWLKDYIRFNQRSEDQDILNACQN